MTTLVVGFGSPHGDDQVGWLVIDELEKNSNGIGFLDVFKSKGNGIDWFNEVREHQHIIFVDAVSSGEPVGTIHSFVIGDDEDSRKIKTSSHAIGLIDSISLAKTLNYLNTTVEFFGIEITRDAPLDAVSKVVMQAIPELVKQIKKSAHLINNTLRDDIVISS